MDLVDQHSHNLSLRHRRALKCHLELVIKLADKGGNVIVMNEIIYRRAPSMRDCLVTSHFVSKNPDYSTAVGTFPCGRCEICSFILNSRDVILPNGYTHTIRHMVTCKTVGVVYLASCECRCFYIGKMKRHFYQGIKDHIMPLFKRLRTTALNRHIGCQHDFDLIVVRFAALEHVPPQSAVVELM